MILENKRKRRKENSFVLSGTNLFSLQDSVIHIRCKCVSRDVFSRSTLHKKLFEKKEMEIVTNINSLIAYRYIKLKDYENKFIFSKIRRY